MFKIIWRTFFGGMVIGFLIIVLFFSCAGISNYKKTDQKPIRLVNASENVYNNNNFVFFEKLVLVDEFDNLCKLSDNCDIKPESTYVNLSSSSGGALRSIDGKVYSLTAAHFCIELNENGTIVDESEFWDEIILVRFTGSVYKGKIEKVDLASDLCLVSFEHDTNLNYVIDKIKLSKKMPPIGEPVHIIASPLGINGTHLRLHFDGKYAGCDRIMGCLYTIPATFGSSGSLVFNKYGELISVLSIAVFPFQEISGGCNVYQIKDFLKKFKQSTGIKLY